MNDKFLSDHEVARVRVRLDFSEPSKNILTEADLNKVWMPSKETPLGEVVWHICALLSWEHGAAHIADSYAMANIRVTGLLGTDP